MEFGLSQSDALSREEATDRIADACTSECVIELGIAAGDEFYWRHSRLVGATDPFGEPIVIVAPTGARGTPLLRVGARVLVYHREGSGGFAFPTTVIDLGTTEVAGGVPIPTASLAPARAVYRYQRRSAVRLRPTEPLEVVCDSRAETGPTDSLQGPSGVVEDISCGGACLRFRDIEEAWIETVAEGAVIRVSLPLPDEEEPLPLRATVVRRSRTAEGGTLTLGVRWRSLTGEQRTQLAYYVTACERAMLQARRRRVEVKGDEPDRSEDVAREPRRRFWRRTARGGGESGSTRSWRRGFEPLSPPDESDDSDPT